MSLAEFFENRSNDPVVVKALQRRATARLALRHFREAIADLESAQTKEPGNAEVEAQLVRARREHEEHKKAKKVLGKAEQAREQPGFDPLGKRAREAAGPDR